MSKIKTRILDRDPNSIFGASKKLSDIAVTNMKNISQNDAIPTPLDSILKPSTNILPQRLPIIPSVNTSVMTKANTDVDEFLSLIKETNSVLESLNILLENYNSSGSGLSKKLLKGGSDVDDDLSFLNDIINTPDSKERALPPPADTDDIDALKNTIQKLKEDKKELDDDITYYNFVYDVDRNLQNRAETYFDSVLEQGHNPDEFINDYKRFIDALDRYNDPDYDTKYSKAEKSNLTKVRNKFLRQYGMPEDLVPVANFTDYLKFKNNKAEESEIDKVILNYENQIKKILGQKAIKENSQLQNLLTFNNKTNPVIDGLNKFNNKMNQLYIFYKGKIKPNIKSISKMKIEDILNDFLILNDNFKDISMQIKTYFKEIFSIDGKTKEKKADSFFDSVNRNVEKILSDIISNTKAYSSSIQAVPLGSGFLLPHAVLRNMHHNHKYLL
jgi:hypothetical protein